MFETSIRPLNAGDAPALAKLLAKQRTDYIAHFSPFEFDERSVAEVVSAARRDCFWALCVEEEIAGFFMLRGFDAGYARPSYGVFVAEHAAGRGLARESLRFALAWCAENGVETVLLKVAQQNQRARRIYIAAGFEFVGICPATGHEMLEKRMQPAGKSCP